MLNTFNMNSHFRPTKKFHGALHVALNASLITIAMCAGSVCAQVSAQSTNPSASNQPPAKQQPVEPAALSAEQLAKVKAVLAPYKPASLTIDEAKLIKRTLRDAGMRRSAALDKAITDAGFSPAKLEALDPTPPRPPSEGMGAGAGAGAPPIKK
jgi:hypothetical protein